jgi:hypothetical protein
MSTDLFAGNPAETSAPNHQHPRSLTMRYSSVQYLVAQETYRERLRQAERYRLARVALRARRALAQQLMR